MPEDFKFAFKANQKITHIKRLKDVAEFTAEFATALQPMGAEGRLGPVLFQLPPYLKCDAGGAAGIFVVGAARIEERV